MSAEPGSAYKLAIHVPNVNPTALVWFAVV